MIQNSQRPGILAPTRHDINEPGCDAGGVEDATVQENCVRFAGFGMLAQEQSKLARNRRIFRIVKSQFLERNARGSLWRIVKTTVGEEPIQNDLLGLFM